MVKLVVLLQCKVQQLCSEGAMGRGAEWRRIHIQ
jgi:hypothetical protein